MNKTKLHKKVIVSVTDDLVTDQRVNRISQSLHNAGYNVLVTGRKFKNSKKLERPYAIKRFRLIFNKKAVFYAEYNIRLFFFQLFSKFDILLSNDTDTLLANYLVSKIRRKPFVFDAHEMFPEVPELVGRQKVKNTWTYIEYKIFPHLKYSYTVCQSIADIYNKKYGINMQVIRNVPFTHNTSDAITIDEKENRHILLYQGAVNIGRGIEWIIDAMEYIDNAVFYIAGTGDIFCQMQKYVEQKQLQDKVIFLGRIPLETLSSITQNADLGMSLLENRGLNYYYSAPNRIADFIHAEVPVIATDFPEISKIVKQYSVGELVTDNSPQNLAKVINDALIKWENINKEEKHQIFAKAKADLCWENEEIKLLSIFNSI